MQLCHYLSCLAFIINVQLQKNYIFTIKKGNSKQTAIYNFIYYGTVDFLIIPCYNISVTQHCNPKEIGMYYLQSRYYDASLGRFLNSDAAEMLGMAVGSNNILATNLFSYCSNRITNDGDLTGYLSENSLVKMFSTTALFGMFTSLLYVNTSKALASISGYVTKIVAPIALRALWWKPVIATLIILAAVSIVVALVYNYFSKKSKGKTKIPGKLKSGDKVKTPNSHKGEFKQKKGDHILMKKQVGSLKSLKMDILTVIIGMHLPRMQRLEIITI